MVADISAYEYWNERILLMSLWQYYQVHDLKQFFNFSISEGIFSAYRGGVALKLTHKEQLITCFLIHKKIIVSLHFIVEIKVGEYWNKRILLMSFLYHVGSTTQTDISSSLTKFYCFNIQRGFSRPRNRCGFEFGTQYTTSHVLSNTSIIIPSSLQLLKYQCMNI